MWSGLHLTIALLVAYVANAGSIVYIKTFSIHFHIRSALKIPHHRKLLETKNFMPSFSQ